MKLRINLNESVNRQVDWVLPSANNTWGNIEALSKKDHWLQKYFPNKDSWIKKFRSGKPTPFNLSILNQIDNADLNIGRIDPELIYNLEPAFQSGQQVSMPVGIQFPDKYLYLVSGNAKLALAAKFKVHPTILVLELESQLDLTKE